VNPILGIDYGRARIGLAISDELHLLAHPLQTVAPGKNGLARIAAVIRERRIDKVVVGIPRNMSGNLGPAADEVLQFVERLHAAAACEVVTWDERLTTVSANRMLQDAGKKTRATRGYVDQVAAQIILQGFLDRQREMAQPEPS
jgi:putative Holliday junction resolvase